MKLAINTTKINQNDRFLLNLEEIRCDALLCHTAVISVILSPGLSHHSTPSPEMTLSFTSFPGMLLSVWECQLSPFVLGTQIAGVYFTDSEWQLSSKACSSQDP